MYFTTKDAAKDASSSIHPSLCCGVFCCGERMAGGDKGRVRGRDAGYR